MINYDLTIHFNQEKEIKDKHVKKKKKVFFFGTIKECECGEDRCGFFSSKAQGDGQSVRSGGEKPSHNLRLEILILLVKLPSFMNLPCLFTTLTDLPTPGIKHGFHRANKQNNTKQI